MQIIHIRVKADQHGNEATTAELKEITKSFKKVLKDQPFIVTLERVFLETHYYDEKAAAEQS